ncbi:Basic helix-loop-helix DNA-binding superfamily protein [Rhynchospora pubera]|uniref:Basic helix-loop-helix DNA-binding superfamily protein n=1 Tax=Rhynchospora pubera TaxID=906938 RepID=A0AAV8C5P8_9POAL|nr:Basic helix-loop-helix DNA-binding superfamily protein [Rhynchospora pubera]
METNMGEASSSQVPQEFCTYQTAPIQESQRQKLFAEEPITSSSCNQTSDSEPRSRGVGEGFIFPTELNTNISSTIPVVPVVSPILSWPPIHSNHQIGGQLGQIFPSIQQPPPQPPPPPLFNEFYARRASAALQFGYEGASAIGSSSSDPLGLAGLYMGGFGSASSPFVGKMTAQEILDAKALAASKSHSEAERRRRERINGHLAKLRSMLPNTTKTDKASLLAEVIQHVKELKRQTSEIAEESPLPTESDELTVDALSTDDEGRLVVRASLCCKDRSDLLPDLIKTLKTLRLRTLKAEITTLAGRVKNVLLITGEETNCDATGDDYTDHVDQLPQQQSHQHTLLSIQEALRQVMERTAPADEGSGGSTKRQRTVSVLDHRSV